MTVENYTNNNDILEFVKEYGAKDILKCLNFKKMGILFIVFR